MPKVLHILPIVWLLAAQVAAVAVAQTPTVGDSLLRRLRVQSAEARQEFQGKRVTAIRQDACGHVWIGTELGLYRYDGYRAKSLLGSMGRPSILTSNKITCLENRGRELWIGTQTGLNRLSLSTGSCRQYHFTDFPNSDNLSALLATRDGRDLWVGTEGGLYRWDERADTFTLMCNLRGNAKVPHCAIKALIEDTEGYVWIGTWDKGLFRYDPRNGEFYEMPRFNDLNNAQTICVDANHRLWVGTWGRGLYRIDNPHDTGAPLNLAVYQTENTQGALPSNMIYSLAMDASTGTVWAGTSRGIALYRSTVAGGDFITLQPEGKRAGSHLFSHGASLLMPDDEGNIWVGTLPTGVAVASMPPQRFTRRQLPAKTAESDLINSLSLDHDGNVWAGLERGGFLCFESDGGRTLGMVDIPAMRGRSAPQGVHSIYETSSDQLLVGTTADGIIVLGKDRLSRTEVNQDNCAWLPDNCVFCFLETGGGDLLVGTWKGLCLWRTDGTGIYLDTDSLTILQDAQVQHITLDRKGRLWLSTRNKGIIRLVGDLRRPQTLRAKAYERLKGTEFRMSSVHKTVADAGGRLWACSRETGLLLYNEREDIFESVSQRYGLPSCDICAMEEGREGNLWLSSGTSVMCLTLSEDGSLGRLRYFPICEDEGDNLFAVSASASARQGRICFAYEGGFISFSDWQTPTSTRPTRSPSITDIHIFNTPIEQLPDKERQGVADTLPPYTHSICLTQKQNDFTICFSSFRYYNQSACRFAYMLEGYDHDWVYPEAGVNTAYYCNLPSGRYSFRLKAADADGEWTEMERPLAVRILPPLWLRWWAVTAYVLVAFAILFFLFMYLRAKEEHRRSLHLARLENEKIEELNHKKMQFFSSPT